MLLLTVPFYQRGFYKISSSHLVMQQKMTWKHQLLFWLHQTGAHEKVSCQRAGGQRDHVWLTSQWQKKMWKPAFANSVGAIQLLFDVVIVDHTPSSVLHVMSACTPDTPSTTEMPVLQDSSSHCPQQLLY